jgi:hypothetical protein
MRVKKIHTIVPSFGSPDYAVLDSNFAQFLLRAKSPALNAILSMSFKRRDISDTTFLIHQNRYRSGKRAPTQLRLIIIFCK